MQTCKVFSKELIVQDFINHFLHFLLSQVKDGANRLLGTFCGDNIPYPLLALSGVIILKFHSNNEDTEKGFRAVFNDSQGKTMLE